MKFCCALIYAVACLLVCVLVRSGSHWCAWSLPLLSLDLLSTHAFITFDCFLWAQMCQRKFLLHFPHCPSLGYALASLQSSTFAHFIPFRNENVSLLLHFGNNVLQFYLKLTLIRHGACIYC